MNAVDAWFENIGMRLAEYAVKKYGSGLDGADRYAKAVGWKFLGGYSLFLAVFVVFPQ